MRSNFPAKRLIHAHEARHVGLWRRDLVGELAGALEGLLHANGGLTSSENAARYPAQLIESMPDAGVIATAELGVSERIGDLIAFDMGGTTAKVGVVKDGRPRLTNEFIADQFVDGRDMGGYQIKSPAIDIIEIGAGGGSIAWMDAAGTTIRVLSGQRPRVRDSGVLAIDIGRDGRDGRRQIARGRSDRLRGDPRGALRHLRRNEDGHDARRVLAPAEPVGRFLVRAA